MKNIIVLTDFSPEATHAAENALPLAAKLGVEILLVNVYAITPYVPLTISPVPNEDGAWENEKRRLSTSRLNNEVRRLERRLSRLKLPGYNPVIRPIALEGVLAECVFGLAWRKKSLMVIMGVSGKPYGDLLFDGDIKAVVKSVKCPVFVIPAAWGGQDIRHILFGTDLEPADEAVLEKLIGFSGKLKASVSLTHVSTPVVMPDFAEDARVSAFTFRIASLYPGISWSIERDSSVMEALEKVSTQKHADVLALRYRKHSLWYRVFNENPLKEAIGHRRMPLLIFPEDAQHND